MFATIQLRFPTGPGMSNYQTLYDQSISDKETFWLTAARDCHWEKFPTIAIDESKPPFCHWFPDGRTNACYNAVDLHVENGRADQTAIIYDSAVTDQIGAVHSVVFGGFAANELAVRIDDCKPKAILAASCGLEPGRVVEYKPLIDQAIELSDHKPDHCYIWQREQARASMLDGRDLDWQSTEASSKEADCVTVDANHPLYILYTSGTTGAPKGVVRDTGGSIVSLKWTMKNIYGVDPGEVYWAASDVGWVVGHSYIVYAPLFHGNTTVLYEGTPVGTPDPGAFWRVISEHNVRVLFTAPTAFRAIKKEDPKGKFLSSYDLSGFRYLFLAGERCDPDTLEWAQQKLKVPVIDHWWQTESGFPMLANMTGIELAEIKPGSAGQAVSGFDIQILDADGQPLPPNTEGAVGIKYPLPPGCLPNLWQDTGRFKSSYLSQFSGYYFSGDGGYKDEEGYVYITGRIDDIINVAGHRLSTAEMEEVVAGHPAVAECAVVGIADDLKGQIPVGFFILKAGVEASEAEIEKELILKVRKTIGPVASFKRAVSVERLPKTRSGKILRKIMRAIADDRPFSPPSTIDDMTVLEELKLLMKEKNIGNLGKIS